jgi:uncharacterized membrane protein YeaQ/YmgE (transglycosylase-associated protein family)
MSIIGFLILVLIAAIAGGIGQVIGGFSRGGCLVSVVLGFVGAFVGLWIARQFGLPPIFVIQVEGEPFPVVWAMIGAAVISAVLGLLLPRRPR